MEPLEGFLLWVSFRDTNALLLSTNIMFNLIAQYNPDKIKAAMADAINLAKNAITILNDHRADEKVQQMVKFILSDDPKKLNHAKGTIIFPTGCLNKAGR